MIQAYGLHVSTLPNLRRPEVGGHLQRKLFRPQSCANEGSGSKFSMDNLGVLRLLPAMAQSAEKLTSPVSLVVDAVLVIAFFLFIYSLVSTHVQSHDPKMILLWGGLCAACMSSVFWLCIQMFRVVLRAQLARK
jgi:hypothetical protein